MFCDLTLTERKLWFAVAKADRQNKDPLLSQAQRMLLAHYLKKHEGETEAAMAISVCVVIPDQRVPQSQPSALLGTKKIRSEAEKYLRNWYRTELEVKDVSLNAGFPSVVMLASGKVVDCLEFLVKEIKAARSENRKD